MRCYRMSRLLRKVHLLFALITLALLSGDCVSKAAAIRTRDDLEHPIANWKDRGLSSRLQQLLHRAVDGPTVLPDGGQQQTTAKPDPPKTELPPLPPSTSSGEKPDEGSDGGSNGPITKITKAPASEEEPSTKTAQPEPEPTKLTDERLSTTTAKRMTILPFFPKTTPVSPPLTITPSPTATINEPTTESEPVPAPVPTSIASEIPEPNPTLPPSSPITISSPPVVVSSPPIPQPTSAEEPLPPVVVVVPSVPIPVPTIEPTALPPVVIAPPITSAPTPLPPVIVRPPLPDPEPSSQGNVPDPFPQPTIIKVPPTSFPPLPAPEPPSQGGNGNVPDPVPPPTIIKVTPTPFEPLPAPEPATVPSRPAQTVAPPTIIRVPISRPTRRPSRSPQPPAPTPFVPVVPSPQPPKPPVPEEEKPGPIATVSNVEQPVPSPAPTNPPLPVTKQPDTKQDETKVTILPIPQESPKNPSQGGDQPDRPAPSPTPQPSTRPAPNDGAGNGPGPGPSSPPVPVPSIPIPGPGPISPIPPSPSLPLPTATGGGGGPPPKTTAPLDPANSPAPSPEGPPVPSPAPSPGAGTVVAPLPTPSPNGPPEGGEPQASIPAGPAAPASTDGTPGATVTLLPSPVNTPALPLGPPAALFKANPNGTPPTPQFPGSVDEDRAGGAGSSGDVPGSGNGGGIRPGQPGTGGNPNGSTDERLNPDGSTGDWQTDMALGIVVSGMVSALLVGGLVHRRRKLAASAAAAADAETDSVYSDEEAFRQHPPPLASLVPPSVDIKATQFASAEELAYAAEDDKRLDSLASETTLAMSYNGSAGGSFSSRQSTPSSIGASVKKMPVPTKKPSLNPLKRFKQQFASSLGAVTNTSDKNATTASSRVPSILFANSSPLASLALAQVPNKAHENDLDHCDYLIPVRSKSPCSITTGYLTMSSGGGDQETESVLSETGGSLSRGNIETDEHNNDGDTLRNTIPRTSRILIPALTEIPTRPSGNLLPPSDVSISVRPTALPSPPQFLELTPTSSSDTPPSPPPSTIIRIASPSSAPTFPASQLYTSSPSSHHPSSTLPILADLRRPQSVHSVLTDTTTPTTASSTTHRRNKSRSYVGSESSAESLSRYLDRPASPHAD
ncbi:hypothetical protein DFS34DRAFT_598679 [Phlyctochytrium arcticum]|nr:hypothetical protein DFS34DRAFT_598679 [Phlyctochytrium arcticum]